MDKKLLNGNAVLSQLRNQIAPLRDYGRCEMFASSDDGHDLIILVLARDHESEAWLDTGGQELIARIQRDLAVEAAAKNGSDLVTLRMSVYSPEDTSDFEHALGDLAA